MSNGQHSDKPNSASHKQRKDKKEIKERDEHKKGNRNLIQAHYIHQAMMQRLSIE